MLLHTWLQDHRGQEDEGLDDFFCILLAEHNAAAAEAVPATELPLSFLASFLTAPGGRALAFAPEDVNIEHLRDELIHKISEEAGSVHVYTKHWRSSGSVEALPQRHVLQETKDRLAATVFPWPRIDRDPLSEMDEGRFVKSFPLEFPMGTGDLRQARVRTDFSVADYMQHVFRYFTGHFLRSIRGCRVVYASFPPSYPLVVSSPRLHPGEHGFIARK